MVHFCKSIRSVNGNFCITNIWVSNKKQNVRQNLTIKKTYKTKNIVKHVIASFSSALYLVSKKIKRENQQLKFGRIWCYKMGNDLWELCLNWLDARSIVEFYWRFNCRRAGFRLHKQGQVAFKKLITKVVQQKNDPPSLDIKSSFLFFYWKYH